MGMLGIVLACTTFLMSGDGGRVVGKSYDWDMGQGLVLVNKRGVAKQALPMMPDDKPARWVSKHASVTFNQYGRELPNGGMNEAGLVVEVMWLDSSKYPAPDGRPTVNELQWVQYQLDNFASVAEMVKAAEDVRVSLVHGKVHYLACDKTGACAAFENVDGRMRVTSGKALPVPVLTNHTYAESMKYLAGHGARPPAGRGSLERFARAAALVQPEVRGDLVKAAFGVLDSVSQGPDSQWNIVYDPVNLKVYFRTYANKKIKSFDFAAFDRSCASAVRLLDIDTDAAGDVTAKFGAYSDEANRKLVEKSLKPIARRLPPGAMEALVKYPSALSCTAASQ
jgi:choloylglycine hydrolase